jgi:hypothetical protein
MIIHFDAKQNGIHTSDARLVIKSSSARLSASPPNLLLSELGARLILTLVVLILVPLLNSSENEVATAITSLPVMIVSAVMARCLYTWRSCNLFRAWIWMGMFGSLALATGVGVITHGFTLNEETRRLLWHAIHAALVPTMVCFAVGAVLDGWGEAAARRTLPGLLMLGAGLFCSATFGLEDFFPFVVFEGVVMLFSLVVYIALALRGLHPGASWMIAGVVITMGATAIQATNAVTFAVLLPFDHNGVFHLVQLPGLLCLCIGLGRHFQSLSPNAQSCPTRQLGKHRADAHEHE